MKSATALFPMGYLASSPTVLMKVPREEMLQMLERHLCGDWGDVSEKDAKGNEYALRHGLRIISHYKSSGGELIQILTEADRSVTTIQLAKEY